MPTLIRLPIFALLLLAGCAVQTYGTERGRIQAGALPTASTALLERSNNRLTLGADPATPYVEVTAVDGTEPTLPLEADYLLAPGLHRASLVQLGWLARPIARTAVSFLAEPGRSYVAKAARVRGQSWFWIEDSKTGEVVGGRRPTRGV